MWRATSLSMPSKVHRNVMLNWMSKSYLQMICYFVLIETANLISSHYELQGKGCLNSIDLSFFRCGPVICRFLHFHSRLVPLREGFHQMEYKREKNSSIKILNPLIALKCFHYKRRNNTASTFTNRALIVFLFVYHQRNWIVSLWL